MLGLPRKLADEDVYGIAVDLEWRADLLHQAVAHDHQPVAERHGLGLVMGDVDDGAFDTAEEEAQFGAHLGAELGVEIARAVRRAERPWDRG